MPCGLAIVALCAKRQLATFQSPLTTGLDIIVAWRQGTFLVARSRVICQCKTCARLPEKKREMSATHFEAHCGAGAAKKWKSSVRIVAGTTPDVPAGAPDCFNNFL